MKLFIIATLLFVVISAEYNRKTRDDLNVARNECISEHKVPDSSIEDYKKRVFTSESPTPCYLRCVLIKLGVFDQTAGLLIDNYVLQLAKGESAGTGISNCFDNTGPDSCLWAYRSFVCLKNGGLLPEGY